ncbi:hypothetical protein [Streptomyces thermodiastaticus]|jgi:hypothetical protein|uniref:hypothetical protein n=1 Tax=Streptomyces thermodiastaticus TaxID=44061 RepID=UPI0016734F54|nr:hypothetical protein [Streptomyces thermodiastaticus]MCE7552787.1 hypothetical protein [Streptomyces thermodiastaticus]GHF88856.1 hypothetical protein GCM10018787_41890 [Streptomyces thermodiastaticus]
MSERTEAIPGLRRLPWRTEGGKPAYLSSDDPNSLLSLMADNVEEQTLTNAETVLGLVKPMYAPGARLTRDEALFMLRRTAECLADAINVARMRGERLAAD